MQAVKQLGCQRAGDRERDGAQDITKKVEKLLKNLLTNERECDILFGHFRSRSERGAKKT